jgi:polar amino acid transport system ATP-binding protein
MTHVDGYAGSGCHVRTDRPQAEMPNSATLEVSGADAAASAVEGRDPVVAARDVHKWFGNNHVLRGVTLDVHRGEVTCLLGRSGSGKTTFLRCINHLETIDSGEIRVDGRFVGYRQRGNRLFELKDRESARRRREIGIVFQQFNLFPHMTALQNVIEGPVRVLGERKSDSVERANDLLRRVGLGDKPAAYPNQLSGGQQQRVAIARALAMRPKLMLFDEPTSSLDPELIGEVLDVMRMLADEGMTMVVVTHELGFARDVADTVVFMHEGMIVESGRPAVVLDNPQHENVRAFLARESR